MSGDGSYIESDYLLARELQNEFDRELSYDSSAINTNHRQPLQNFDTQTNDPYMSRDNCSSTSRFSELSVKRWYTCSDQAQQIKRPRANHQKAEIRSVISPNGSANRDLPSGLYFTSVRDLPCTTKQRSISVTLYDVLCQPGANIVQSAQINFMFDIPWLLRVYSRCYLDHTPLLVLHGMDERATATSHSIPSHVHLRRILVPYPYGVHHSKIMLLRYTAGARVVIHTANMIADDWTNKTQQVWLSPFLPHSTVAPPGDGDCTTHFKHDFLAYLAAYDVTELSDWISYLTRCDFSAIGVYFVASVPGYWRHHSRHKWGHCRVRRLMTSHSGNCTGLLVAQCSSIGSLGRHQDEWLASEFAASFGARTVRVVYPSRDCVLDSVEGAAGGSCLPYRRATHTRQRWLHAHLCHWRSQHLGRTRAMPHVKCYTRFPGNTCPHAHSPASCYLLTSANLSKAAWGVLQRDSTQLFVRSYEAGVMYIPQVPDTLSLELSARATGTEVDGQRCGTILLPYDLPLVPYSACDEPWTFECMMDGTNTR